MTDGPLAGTVAVLANPTAGRGRYRNALPAVLTALRSSGRPVEVLAAGNAVDAVAACHKAIGDGAAALVAVGGDGTLNLALQAAAGTGVPFGIVPGGTGNDFAAQMGMATDPVAAAGQIAGALLANRFRPVDLARMVGP